MVVLRLAQDADGTVGVEMLDEPGLLRLVDQVEAGQALRRRQEREAEAAARRQEVEDKRAELAGLEAEHAAMWPELQTRRASIERRQKGIDEVRAEEALLYARRKSLYGRVLDVGRELAALEEGWNGSDLEQ